MSQHLQDSNRRETEMLTLFAQHVVSFIVADGLACVAGASIFALLRKL